MADGYADPPKLNMANIHTFTGQTEADAKQSDNIKGACSLSRNDTWIIRTPPLTSLQDPVTSVLALPFLFNSTGSLTSTLSDSVRREQYISYGMCGGI